MLTIGVVTSVSIQSYYIIDSIPHTVFFVPVTYLFRSQNSVPLNPFLLFCPFFRPSPSGNH